MLIGQRMKGVFDFNQAATGLADSHATVEQPSYGDVRDENSINALLQAIYDVKNRRRVRKIISRLEADYWLERNLVKYAQEEESWFDTATFLNWYARTFQPAQYLEIGVRRGRSMAQVLVESPTTDAFGFDLWIPDYASLPESGIVTTNPGPEFVLRELQKFDLPNLPCLIRGDSHEAVPTFFSVLTEPQSFELILVDGDHTAEGARADLQIAFEHLAPGGALVFDDISHPAHPDLRAVWDEFERQYPDYLFINDASGNGTGVAFRPPFERLFARVL